MNKREERQRVKENRMKLFVGVWETEKARGTSLSAFCRDYGLCRQTFYDWIKKAGRSGELRPIRRADPGLKQKAVEIYLRYKGTWSGETISMVLGGRLSPATIRQAVRPYLDLWRPCAVAPKKRGKVLVPPDLPNVIWSVDWTEYKIRGRKYFIPLMLDEASRFFLNWDVLDRRPKSEDVVRALDRTLDRYDHVPLILKSDRAKVFFSGEWERSLSRHRIAPHRIRPRVPQDQGIIERAIREIKTWLKVNRPTTREELERCLDEGIWMLNFLKPKAVLGGKTPASAHFARTGAEIESKALVAAEENIDA